MLTLRAVGPPVPGQETRYHLSNLDRLGVSATMPRARIGLNVHAHTLNPALSSLYYLYDSASLSGEKSVKHFTQV